MRDFRRLPRSARATEWTAERPALDELPAVVREPPAVLPGQSTIDGEIAQLGELSSAARGRGRLAIAGRVAVLLLLAFMLAGVASQVLPLLGLL